MAKLPVEESNKPVITKAKNKGKAKNKLNDIKVEAIKSAVLPEKNAAKENKTASPVIKVEVQDIKIKKEPKSPKQELSAPSKVIKKKNKKPFKGSARLAIKPEAGDKIKNENSSPVKKGNRAPPSVPVEFAEKYPIFKNEEFVAKFLNVSMTNNQKGRIRQTYRDNFKGTSDEALPELIHNKIKSLANDKENLQEGGLRKIRILYNMLRLTMEKTTNNSTEVTEKKNNNKKTKNNPQNGDSKENGDSAERKESKKKQFIKKENTENATTDVKQDAKKIKGPKRYVVFVGNLPLDIDREKIMEHFSDLKDHIADVRIPKVTEEKKSAIAYVELTNEPSYELALSKHHSMMANKRINVLYSVQQNSKLSKTEAKGKAAKMVALQKSGKLMGSVPLNKKRSQRRAKAKKAQAQADKD